MEIPKTPTNSSVFFGEIIFNPLDDSLAQFFAVAFPEIGTGNRDRHDLRTKCVV